MIRKTPTKVTVLDLTSMYPTMTMLLGIWEFITNKGVEFYDVCKEIWKLIDSTNLTTLQNQEIWELFVVLVQIQPDDDIFPVRMDYTSDNSSFTVGINHITSTGSLWYAPPDVILSELLTGKSLKIIKALLLDNYNPVSECCYGAYISVFFPTTSLVMPRKYLF